MGSEELTMNSLLLLSIFSINIFFIVDGKSVANATDKANKTEEGKEAEEGKDKVNPGYADHLAIPCIRDNEENNKYLKSVQPDVEKYFPMNGETNAEMMPEYDPVKYQEEYMKFSEKFKNELQDIVAKDGKDCIKLNFKWAFMIDSILNTDIPAMEDLGGTDETKNEEEKEVKEEKSKKEEE